MPVTGTFAATAGQVFKIAVDGYNPGSGAMSGPFTIAVLDVTDTIALPAGAVAIVDFVNNAYQYGATSNTAAEVIDHPEYIIPGVGLLLATEAYNLRPQDAAAKLLGAYKDYLIAGNWTIVIEWFRTEGFFAAPLNMSGPLTDDYETEDHVFWGMEDDEDYSFIYENTPDERDTWYEDWLGPGLKPKTQCWAITRTDARGAVSLNGDTVHETVLSRTGFAGPITQVIFSGDQASLFGTGCIIARLVIYPEQLNAALPGLAVASSLRPPPNDDFADATALVLNEAAVGSNFLATAEVGEPEHNVDSSLATVWWKFTAPATKNYTVDLAKSSMFNGTGPGLAIYTGSTVNNLALVLAENGSYLGPPEPQTFAATSGVTYYIAVAGRDDVSSLGVRFPQYQSYHVIQIKVTE